MARTSLDDILAGNNEPEPETQEAAAPVVEDQPEVGQPRDEHGKFAPKGVKPETQETPAEPEAGPPPAKELPKDVYEPLRAVRDENKALKERLDQLQREIEQRAQPQEPPAPPPSMWDDEQGWQQHFGSQVASQAVQQAAYHNKLMTSEFYARKNIEGFEEVYPELNKWLSDNPSIAQQAAADFDPWGFAYRQYQNQRTIQELGATDVATLEQRLREKIMAELQATQPAPAPAIPQSLANRRNVGSRSGPAWSGPTPLGDLIGN